MLARQAAHAAPVAPKHGQMHHLRAAAQRPQCRRQPVRPARAIELDFSDPDTQVSLAGMALGLLFGLGAPTLYIKAQERDEERLEELRSINRATFQETGDYMNEDEIASIRKPKWTDRREWQDDD